MSDMPPPNWVPPTPTPAPEKPAEKPVEAAPAPLIDLAASKLDPAGPTQIVAESSKPSELPAESVKPRSSGQTVNEGAASMRLGRRGQLIGGGNESGSTTQEKFSLGTWSCVAMFAAIGVGPAWQAWRAFEQRDWITVGIVAAIGVLGVGVAYGIAVACYRMSHRSHSFANAAFTVLMLLGLSGSLLTSAMHEAGVFTNLASAFGPRSAKAEPASTPSVTVTMDDVTGAIRSESIKVDEPLVEPAVTPRAARTEPTPTAADLRDVGIVNAQELIQQATKSAKADPAAARAAFLDALAPLVSQLRGAMGEHKAAFTAMLPPPKDYTKNTLDARVNLIRRALKANRVLDATYVKGPSMLAAALRESNVPDETVSTLVAAAFPNDRLAKTAELRLVQRELCAAMEEETRALSQNFGKWTAETKEGRTIIRFRSTDDAQRHQRAMGVVQSRLERQRALIDEMRVATGK
jgi:hypothetical protein